jgi:hypothetical protein
LEKGLNPRKLPSRKTVVLDKKSLLFILFSAFHQGKPKRGNLETGFKLEYYRLNLMSSKNTICSGSSITRDYSTGIIKEM